MKFSLIFDILCAFTYSIIQFPYERDQLHNAHIVSEKSMAAVIE